MRPPSILNFERVVLLGLALGVLSSFLTWDDTVAAVSATGMGSGTVIAIQAVTIALYLILLWFISRKGSPVAKWIYVVISVISLAIGLAGFGQIMKSGALQLILTLAQYALALVSLWLLFRPDAKAYFADGRG
jgi:glucan phosphoethanolaminetransferase (alkaline phosphatase superfamily)